MRKTLTKRSSVILLVVGLLALTTIQGAAGQTAATGATVAVADITPERLSRYPFLGSAEVRAVSLKGWNRVSRGHLPTESVIIVYRTTGGWGARLLPETQEKNQFTFEANKGVVRAIIHTHPVSRTKEPAGGDLDVAKELGVPIFTIHRAGLYVYDPKLRKTELVSEGVRWVEGGASEAANVARPAGEVKQ